MVASQGGYTDVVELLLQNGANHTLSCGKYVTALELAATDGCVGAVESLLRHGADPNPRDIADPALNRAVVEGHIDVVRTLLDHGAGIRVESSTTYLTLFLQAIAANRADIVKLLLQESEDIENHGPDGIAPLMHGIYLQSVDVCETLIDLGADIDAKDSRGRRPLWWAHEFGNARIADTLSGLGARVGGGYDPEDLEDVDELSL